ncbi:hypothetical protein [Microbispora bryophytorum]|nr:hypothetical protein [Microbispora bryophytorum]MBD3138823.1 hypothetical protein [Microbispora bryophytorum]TQS10085.1 hypothetical protein FLX07_03425 [Microbispora bryophytorum]
MNPGVHATRRRRFGAGTGADTDADTDAGTGAACGHLHAGCLAAPSPGAAPNDTELIPVRPADG